MSTAVLGEMAMPANFPYRSVYLKGRPVHQKYDDFWRKHPPMDAVHRAKIFAPFDALAGYSDCIAGKQIVYCDRRCLSEGEREALDRKLSILRNLTRNGREARNNQPQIIVEYFLPCCDENSFAYGTGGTYETISGICRKVDTVSGTITIDDHVLPIDDITSTSGALFETSDIDIP